MNKKMTIIASCALALLTGNVRAEDTTKQYVLIINLYNETRPERIAEYLTCLMRNVEHKAITTIHVVYDTSSDNNTNVLMKQLADWPNLVISYINKRPTYQHCFEIANRLYSGRTVIISNADIFFNETLNQLDHVDLTNKFLALTRWEVNKDNSIHLLHGDKPFSTSQDAWIFHAPLRTFDANIPMGIPGCDNAIAFRAQAALFEVINPCLTIQCCHLHQSDIRNYSSANVVPPPYLALPIIELPSQLAS